MKRKMFLFVAALVLLFVQKMWAQLDFDPEVIWESTSPVGFSDLKFSPDDKFFYVRNDGGIHKFNSENGEYMGIFVEGWFHDFAFVEEYNWLVCAGQPGLQIRDMQTGALIKVLSQDSGAGSMGISPNHKRLVFSQGHMLIDGNIIPLNMYVYSLPDLQEIAVAKGIGSIDNKFINENEIAVATPDADNYDFHIYSIPQNKYIRKLAVINGSKYGSFKFIQISPDYKNLIAANSLSVNFYDIETGELRNKITDVGPYYFGFNPTGKYYVLCDFNQNSIYNYVNHKELFRIGNNLYSSIRFLNVDNKKLLTYKFGVFKMLHFDFDSLATGVITKEEIPIIYPNPSNEYVIIPIDSELITKVTISDYTGRDFPAVFIMESGEKANSIRLNVTMIPNGTYLVTIQGGKYPKSYKLIKGE